MKRLPALLILLFFLTAGCGAKEPTTVIINRSFCSPAAVEHNGRLYEADVTVTPEQCAAVFLRPEAVKGLTMICRSGRVTVRYGENETETPLPDPQQSFLYWLGLALSQTEAAVTRKEDAFLLQATVQNRKYWLTVDAASFQPLCFEMDSLDLTVKFQTGR